MVSAGPLPTAFRGGRALPALKPARTAIRRLPLPPRLRVPLLQHAGAPCAPCVVVGQRVARFELIGRPPPDELGAPVHAPAAGLVVGLEQGPVALPGTPDALHVLIDVDPTGAECRLAALDPWTADPATLRARIAEAGVVGLGGAGFPTAGKLEPAARTLVLNGAECEPVVACDQALLAASPGEVLAAGRMLARIIGADAVLLAVEARMLDAIEALRIALASGDDDAAPPLRLVVLPDRYPAGGERQLVEAVTGRALRDGELPRDAGLLVQNVASAVAALRAVRDGEPLVSRLVTVGGDGLAEAATFEVAVGTPAAALGEALGGWRHDARVLRAGGPMMGVPLPDDSVAIGKTTIALTAWRQGPREALPCIRCGDCAEACPSALFPQLLHARLGAGDAAGAAGLGLMACIECGLCDAVCPSGIALTAGFVAARAAERERQHRADAAAAARARFEHRNERLQREADEAAKAQDARASRAQGAAAAALAKARAKRGKDGP